MTIQEYIGKLPIEIEAEILNLVDECKIQEQYDIACDLIYTWTIDGSIVGVIAFKKFLFPGGVEIPRIEHIFGTKAVQKTIQGPRFLIKVFGMVAKKGFKQVWCYITPKRKDMMDYAEHFGFKVYKEDLGNKYLVKNL